MKNEGTLTHSYVIMNFHYHITDIKVIDPINKAVVNVTKKEEPYTKKENNCTKLKNCPETRDEKYMEGRTMKANITDIDIFGLVTVNFTGNLDNHMFNVTRKDTLFSKFSRGL